MVINSKAISMAIVISNKAISMKIVFNNKAISMVIVISNKAISMKIVFNNKAISTRIVFNNKDLMQEGITLDFKIKFSHNKIINNKPVISKKTSFHRINRIDSNKIRGNNSKRIRELILQKWN